MPQHLTHAVAILIVGGVHDDTHQEAERIVSRTEGGKAVADTDCWVLEIVERTDAHNFVVLPKCWTVGRTLAWISRNRRLVRDFERYARTVAAFVRVAMIRLMLRRLTRPPIQPESRLLGSALRAQSKAQPAFSQ